MLSGQAERQMMIQREIWKFKKMVKAQGVKVQDTPYACQSRDDGVILL